MPEKIFAAIVVAVCAVLLLRLVLGPAKRARFDSTLRRWGRTLSRRSDSLFAWPGAQRRAKREAEAAIRRAREQGQWEGNVYRPKSFKKDRKIH